MKTATLWCGVIILLLGLQAGLVAQVTGDYRSNGTGGGNWNAAGSWQRYNGSAWVAAAVPPTGAELSTVRSTDSVYFNVPVSITGTLVNQGRLGGAASLTIADGGTYQHDQDAGSIPVATWSTGSTMLLTGSVSGAPDNRNQSFHNVTFDTPGLLSNLNMSWDSVTIGGDIRVLNTGSARWYMTTALAGDSSMFTIMGDVIVTGGQFSTNGTSNAATKFTIHHYGDVIVTGGNLSISRGSQGSGTGSTRWYLHEGSFLMSNGTTQNSNAANAWFVFDAAGEQALELGAGNTLTSLPVVVAPGTRLVMGLSKLRGSGRFILPAGATMVTALEGGVDSAIVVTGTLELNSGANYVFDGPVAQVTGTTMPATVNDLVINNPAGVTLSQATTVNGVLRLQAGVFNNTIPFTLGPSGSISYEGGSLLIPVSVEADGGDIPREFTVSQNYPNPFNPSTTVTIGLPSAAPVRVAVYNLLGREVAVAVNGRLNAGTHVVELDGSALPSGVYFYRVDAGSLSMTKRMVLLK